MKTATMAGAALAGLLALALAPAVMAQTPPPPAATAPAKPAAAQPAPAQTAPSASPSQAPPSQVAPQQAQRPPGARERRRRASYASCNRMSHAKNLRGGVRRRFLIRCKLGYVKPRSGQPTQPPPARQP